VHCHAFNIVICDQGYDIDGRRTYRYSFHVSFSCYTLLKQFNLIIAIIKTICFN